MKISASIQAANQLDLLNHIDSNNTKFDQLHIDITDGHFAENISMSFKVIEMLKNNTDYYLDIHLMINDNLKYGEIAFDCGADLVTVHKESTELKDFIKLSEFNKNIGIGLLPSTSNSELDERKVVHVGPAITVVIFDPGPHEHSTWCLQRPIMEIFCVS